MNVALYQFNYPKYEDHGFTPGNPGFICKKYFLRTTAIPRDILEFSKPGADVIGGSIVHTYSATYLGMAFRKHQYKLKTKKNHGITPGPYSEYHSTTSYEKNPKAKLY